MIIGTADLAVLAVLLASLLGGVLVLVVFFVALYFVVRKAVLDALRKHDELVGRNG